MSVELDNIIIDIITSIYVNLHQLMCSYKPKIMKTQIIYLNSSFQCILIKYCAKLVL
jgi:hypothetical protein